MVLFLVENLFGKGGYAEVYKGCLQDGQLIAVKRLTKGTADERTSGFLSELGIIAHVDHPNNTAKLIGCGIEGGMHLIFQEPPATWEFRISSSWSVHILHTPILELKSASGLWSHGFSLIKFLSSKDNKLAWSKRYKIAPRTADGLLYLHESCQRRIIHRDINADNILLTEDFEPQVSLNTRNHYQIIELQILPKYLHVVGTFCH
jgi:serine/threonine protein kinase